MGCGYSKLEADEERSINLRRSRSSIAAGKLSLCRRSAVSPAAILSPEEREEEDFSPADGANSSEDKEEGRAAEKKKIDLDLVREGEMKALEVSERKEEEKEIKRSASSFIRSENEDFPGSPSFRFYYLDQIRVPADDDETLIPAEKTRKNSTDSTSSDSRTLPFLSRSPTSPGLLGFSRLNPEADVKAPKRFRERALKGLTKGTGSVYGLFKHKSLPYINKASSLPP